MSLEIGLVSCVKKKRDEPTVPKDLYTSDYFKKMRSYAEQYHNDWYILSAKHGVLRPNGEPIEPYNQMLGSATKAEQQEWAKRVKDELSEMGILEDRPTLVIHAGKPYYEELLPLLEDSEMSIEIPTEGLQIGKTKAWYKERL